MRESGERSTYWLRLSLMWKVTRHPFGFRPRWGFSLTELLVAIAIILVAISIILTVLSAAMKVVRAMKG